MTRRASCRHALRTARAWSLDGLPLLAISVFAVAGIALDELLARRFATLRTVYRPTAGQLGGHGFELLATGQAPHYTVRLLRADGQEPMRISMTRISGCSKAATCPHERCRHTAVIATLRS